MRNIGALSMPRKVPPVSVDADEVVLYAHIACRACFTPHLIRTSGQRPFGRIPAGRLYIKQRRYEHLTFSCRSCGYPAANLLDVTEATIRITTPQRDPHPALPRPRLFLCEAPA